VGEGLGIAQISDSCGFIFFGFKRSVKFFLLSLKLGLV
jgi:hypothetical protein